MHENWPILTSKNRRFWSSWEPVRRGSRDPVCTWFWRFSGSQRVSHGKNTGPGSQIPSWKGGSQVGLYRPLFKGKTVQKPTKSPGAFSEGSKISCLIWSWLKNFSKKKWGFHFSTRGDFGKWPKNRVFLGPGSGPLAGGTRSGTLKNRQKPPKTRFFSQKTRFLTVLRTFGTSRNRRQTVRVHEFSQKNPKITCKVRSKNTSFFRLWA